MTNLFLLAEDSSGGNGSSWIILVVLGVMLVATMLLSIIPQKKRQKKAQEMMAGIKVGTKIKTIGGFVGIIKMIDNSQGTFIIDISANGDGSTLVTIDKGAVYTVINPAAEGQAAPENGENATVVSAENNAPVAADDVVEDAQAAEKKAAKKKKKSAKAQEKAEAQENSEATETGADESAAAVDEQSERSNVTGIDADVNDLKF